MIDCTALRLTASPTVLTSPLLTFLFLFLLLCESYIVARIIEALPRPRVSPDWFHRKDSNNPNYQSTVRYARARVLPGSWNTGACLLSLSALTLLLWVVILIRMVPCGQSNRIVFSDSSFFFPRNFQVFFYFRCHLTVFYRFVWQVWVKYTLETVLLPGCSFLSGGIVRETVHSWVT